MGPSVDILRPLLKGVQWRLLLPDGVAFTGEGKPVRKATGDEQKKMNEATLSTSGSRVARAELPVPSVLYRAPTDFSDKAELKGISNFRANYSSAGAFTSFAILL